jgi:hypothetical protein
MAGPPLAVRRARSAWSDGALDRTNYQLLAISLGEQFQLRYGGC